MMQRRWVFVLFAFLTIGGASVLHASPTEDQKQSSEHVAWVAEVLQRLSTIRPGMTRKTLLTVVTTRVAYQPDYGVHSSAETVHSSRSMSNSKPSVAPTEM